MPGIGVIYNPRSGQHLRDPDARRRLAGALRGQGTLREVSSLEALGRTAAEFRELDIDVLGLSGGDGTTGVTISGFIDAYAGQALPRVALLRGGTANAIADSIDVPRAPPERLLASVLDGYGSGRSLREVPCPVMRVSSDNARRDDGQQTAPSTYGFLFGTGVVCGYLREYYAGGEPSPKVAAKTLLRAIGSSVIRGPMIQRMARPYHGSARLDDGTQWAERNYLSIAAGTVEHIGLGFRPFYRASERTDAFHILGIYTHPLGFIRQLDRIRTGRAMRAGHTYEALAKSARFESSARPLTYMVDGDLYRCDGGLEVTLGPTIRLVL